MSQYQPVTFGQILDTPSIESPVLHNLYLYFYPTTQYIMATMRTLVVTPNDKTVTVQVIPVPEPQPNQILVRVSAVALNRVDWLYTANPVAAQDHRVVGSDFAGEVIKVGEDLVNHADPRTKIGTRVAGFVQGGKSTSRTGRYYLP